MTTYVPAVLLHGTAEERGEQHGVQLKDRISATWEWYANYFTLLANDSSSDVIGKVEDLANHFATVIKDFDEDYCTEIEAIAKGSGLDAWKIYAINSRTEIMYNLKRDALATDLQNGVKIESNGRPGIVAEPAAAPACEVNELDSEPSECTSVFCSEYSILAQNWDWNMALEKLIVLFKVVREDGHSYMTVAEPGMLAKIGVSSTGVGCLLNAMDCGKHLIDENLPPLDGVPIHILLRSALDASSFEGALDKIQGCTHNTSSHIFLGCSSGGKSALMEFGGDVLNVDLSDFDTDKSKGNAFRIHTNHYLQCGLANHAIHGFPKGAEMNSSRSRYLRGSELIADIPTEGAISCSQDAIDLTKSILGDQKGAAGDGKFPICMPFTEKSLAGMRQMGKTGTVATVIMDLDNFTIHLTRGSPLANEYEVEKMQNE